MADPAYKVWMPRLTVAGKVLLLVVALDAFFVAIKLLGAFKDLGLGYGEELIVELAANPAIGLLLGILVTSVIQSSSTTTSLVVGLAATWVFGKDPVLAAKMAVPIIMGANIGTAVTSTLVSLGHIGNINEFRRAFAAATVHDFFNLLAVVVWFPLQATTNFLGRLSLLLADLFDRVGGLTLVSPLSYAIDPQKHVVKEFFADYPDATYFCVIVAFVLGAFGLLKVLTARYVKDKRTMLIGIGGVAGLSLAITLVIRHPQYIFIPETGQFLFALGALFTALWGIVTLMKSLLMKKVEKLFHDVLFKSDLRSMGLGLLVTATVQSSSVTTSLAVPLAGAGIIRTKHVFPFALGANVGTTVTALLAALATGESIGLAMAFAHFIFNILGIAVWYPLRRVPIWLAEKLAELSVSSRAFPVLFIVVIYIVLPVVVISLLR